MSSKFLLFNVSALSFPSIIRRFSNVNWLFTFKSKALKRLKDLQAWVEPVEGQSYASVK